MASSSVFTQEIKRSIQIPDVYLSTPLTAVRHKLDSLLSRYPKYRWNSDTDAILLSYDKVKIHNKQAAIYGDFGTCLVTVRYTGHFLRPTKGAEMQGRVTDSSSGFLGVSVQNQVYIVIPKDNINSTKLTHDEIGWKLTKSKTYLQPGDSISFTFTE